MSNDESIGQRLRLIRNDLPQGDFADMLGISRSTLQRYESDTNAPDANVIVMLNELFKVDFNWFLTGQGEAMPTKKMIAATLVTSPRERRLINAFRDSTEEGKDLVERVLKLSQAQT